MLFSCCSFASKLTKDRSVIIGSFSTDLSVSLCSYTSETRSISIWGCFSSSSVSDRIIEALLILSVMVLLYVTSDFSGMLLWRSSVSGERCIFSCLFFTVDFWDGCVLEFEGSFNSSTTHSRFWFDYPKRFSI